MRGRRSLRPLAEVADAAVDVFVRKGFRSAGISDVSAALGLSHGALYTYVDSKQALLYLALLRAIDPEAVRELAIPVSSPLPAEVVTVVEKWASDQTLFSGAPAAEPLKSRPVDEELGEVIDLLYGFIERNRRVLRLVERCASDLPELARWYFVERRRVVFAGLADYLRRQIDAGRLRPVPDMAVAARFVVETIAWFALHRHGDPDSAMLRDEECRRTVRHLLLAALLPISGGTVLDHGAEAHGGDR